MSSRLTDARWRHVAMMIANSCVDLDADTATATAALEIGGTASKFKLGNITKYNVNGVQYVKASTDNIEFASWDTTNEPLVDFNAAGDTALKCLVLVLINAAGTVTVRQSEIVAAADDDPDLPAMPTNGLYASMGSITIETNAATAFAFTTTLLSAAGITDTYTSHTWPTSGPSHLNFIT